MKLVHAGIATALMGSLFPIGIEKPHLYDYFCYGSSNGYQGHINIGSSAPGWPGTVQKHADTSTRITDGLIG